MLKMHPSVQAALPADDTMSDPHPVQTASLSQHLLKSQSPWIGPHWPPAAPSCAPSDRGVEYGPGDIPQPPGAGVTGASALGAVLSGVSVPEGAVAGRLRPASFARISSGFEGVPWRRVPSTRLKRLLDSSSSRFWRSELSIRV